MSSIVSYQFPQDFNSEALTNGGVISPLVSYQYAEWPGDDVLHLQSSRQVSYYYPGSDGPQIVLRGRVTGAGGAPLSGAGVWAAWGTLPVASTSTDANGNYSLPLPAGVYALTASASGYAKSSRAFTLNVGAAPQSFQLAVLPSAPGQEEVSRSPTVSSSSSPIGELKLFDGFTFVSLGGGNTPHLDRMTVVMTHGFNSSPNEWAKGMAAEMQSQGVTSEKANIFCWDWQEAAVPLAKAYAETGGQGVALGRELQRWLGVGYFKELHFLGHSFGTLVNAAAVNFLRGDAVGHEDVSQTPWYSKPIHVTLFDHAERGNLLNQELLYDGISLNLVEAVDELQSSGNYTWEWQRAMPVSPTWVDNYVSLVGFYQAKAVNVNLRSKASGGLAARHSYAWSWYTNSIGNPTYEFNPLGFKRSFEYVVAKDLAASTFPPSDSELSPGSRYTQIPWSSNPLALQRDLTVREAAGITAHAVVSGTVSAVQTAGNVALEIRDTAQAAGRRIASGFNYVGGVALEGGETLLNLFDSPVLRILLRTSRIFLPNPTVSPDESFAFYTAGAGESGSSPMAWLPMEFPANATAMAFDFTVEGDPMDDVLVCGIGTNNLFSLGAKYIPTNTISASRLIDVSAWSGTKNELFFGFMGGTSTNATLVIENIRFYSITAPRLEIARGAGDTVLSWPSSAGGYVVETTPALDAPTWEALTNAPVLSGNHYFQTNSSIDQSRFFRLRAR